MAPSAAIPEFSPSLFQVQKKCVDEGSQRSLAAHTAGVSSVDRTACLMTVARLHVRMGFWLYLMFLPLSGIASGVFWQVLELALAPEAFAALHSVADLVEIATVPLVTLLVARRPQACVLWAYVLIAPFTPLAHVAALAPTVGVARRLLQAAGAPTHNVLVRERLGPERFVRVPQLAPLIGAATGLFGGKITVAHAGRPWLSLWIGAVLMGAAVIVLRLVLRPASPSAVPAPSSVSLRPAASGPAVAMVGCWLLVVLGVTGARDTLVKPLLAHYGMAATAIPDYRAWGAVPEMLLSALAACGARFPARPGAVAVYTAVFGLALSGAAVGATPGEAHVFNIVEGASGYLAAAHASAWVGVHLGANAQALVGSGIALTAVCARTLALHVLLPTLGLPGTFAAIADPCARGLARRTRRVLARLFGRHRS